MIRSNFFFSLSSGLSSLTGISSIEDQIKADILGLIIFLFISIIAAAILTVISRGKKFTFEMLFLVFLLIQLYIQVSGTMNLLQIYGNMGAYI